MWGAKRTAVIDYLENHRYVILPLDPDFHNRDSLKQIGQVRVPCYTVAILYVPTGPFRMGLAVMASWGISFSPGVPHLGVQLRASRSQEAADR